MTRITCECKKNQAKNPNAVFCFRYKGTADSIIVLYALVCCPHDNNNCALTDSFTFCAKKYYDIKYKLQTQFSCCFTVAAEYNLELSFC